MLLGFEKQRLFYTQGDFDLLQCSTPCHNKTYESEDRFREMTAQTKDCCIPTELIPRCPVCGEEMTCNMRVDDQFVEDSGWHAAAERYRRFLEEHQGMRILFLELGVGFNSPGVIKYPFWRMTADNENAVYAVIGLKDAVCPNEIKDRSICIDGDIAKTIEELLAITKS